MRFVGAITFALVLFVAGDAAATDASTTTIDAASKQLFSDGVRALQKGSWSEAIANFEKMADRGSLHPDASFDRAVAYIERARSPQAKPGDLGRAAAALAETIALRPEDKIADQALERLHEEIARRRASRGAEPVDVNASLGRAIVGLFPEDTWAAGAAAGSILLSVGLAVTLWRKHAAARLSGMLSAGVGLVLLVTCGAVAAIARQLRITEAPAVVVASEARLLDERAVPLSAPAGALVPEGGEVQVVDQRSGLARVEWGKTTGWVLRNQLRILPRL